MLVRWFLCLYSDNLPFVGSEEDIPYETDGYMWLEMSFMGWHNCYDSIAPVHLYIDGWVCIFLDNFYEILDKVVMCMFEQSNSGYDILLG